MINVLDIIFFVIYMFLVPKMLHIMQLESYHNSDFKNWMYKNPKRAFKEGTIQFGIILGSYILITLIYYLLLKLNIQITNELILAKLIIIETIFIITNVIIIIKNKKERKNAKKPLKYTARAKRLAFSNFLIAIILEVFFIETLYAISSIDIGYVNNTPYLILIYSFIIMALPLNMIISNIFISPTEELINNHYINSAKRKLKKKEYKNLIKIGITGSYGKTSTKFILQTILSEKYNVLATPESYNTTMGNVRTIREKLKPEHQIFISEMGARKRLDIQEICNFVKPQIGIITSIGKQHLETFKKIENIIKTKSELINSLPQDGVVFLPKNNEYCFEIYQKEKREKYLYSTSNNGADIYATDIKLDENGSTFTVVTKDEKFKCTTKLLGSHNVENIMGCIAIAKHLGLTKEEIIRGVSKIEPIPHRLQILPTNNGTIVIDDAFNSNPVGSKMALDVLSKFVGRKIIITPGMVELGEEEYELNKEFGKYMAEKVDIAILIGTKRSEPIEKGLKENKFNELNIYVVNTLEEATKTLAKITQKGDVILFENDLPDNY